MDRINPSKTSRTRRAAAELMLQDEQHRGPTRSSFRSASRADPSSCVARIRARLVGLGAKAAEACGSCALCAELVVGPSATVVARTVSMFSRDCHVCRGPMSDGHDRTGLCRT